MCSSSYPVFDVGNLESFGVSELVAYLKTVFKAECFDKVEQILRSREEKLKLEREGLEKELRVYKDKYCTLGKLEVAVVGVEAELNKYKLMCEDLSENVTRLEEDCKIVGERERRARERISNLVGEVESVNRDKNKEVIELKARNRDLEVSKQRIEDELEAQRKRYNVLVARVTKLEKVTSDLISLESQVSGKAEMKLEVGTEISKMKIKDNTSSSDGRVHDFVCHSLVKQRGGEQVEGPPVNLLSKTLTNHKEERMSSCIGRVATQNVIEIVDSENESEFIPKENLPYNVTRRTCSSQKDEVNESSCGEKYPSVSTLKRKRRLKLASSDSEDGDGQPLTSIVKMKNRKEIGTKIHGSDCGKQNYVAPSVSYGEEKKRKAEKVPLKSFEMGGTSYKNLGNLVNENTNGNDVEEVGSAYEGRSLDELRVVGSGGSDRGANSINSGKAKDSISKFLSSIRERKDSELKWEHEIDMVSSFQANPTLCMKAVCALYRQHNKAMGGSLNLNKQGFSRSDEERGKRLANFLMEGQEGEMKKSVRELEMYNPREFNLEECKRLAKCYSEQLFTIYQKKEDPLFP